MKHFLLPLLAILFSTVGNAQQSNDIKQSIISEALYSDDGALTVSWIPKSTVERYSVYYRENLDANWILAEASVLDTFYTFSQTFDGIVEVYIQTAGGDNASGYILVGNEYFEGDVEENMLILVTDSIYIELNELIANYQAVLSDEMITSEVIVVNQSMPVPDVKNIILESNSNHTLDYLLILGHVAVPYAGNYAIDGHSNHEGAWVADSYYGDINGTWTDISVNNTSASREANHNVPGDGKFDNTNIASPIEIAVGRVDFSDLPKLEQSEVELTRRYLQRNIDYRMGNIKATNRAVIDNNFNLAEGFAQGAIKSFHTFLEPDSINYGAFSQVTNKDYLFAFGAGGGNYQGASGIINTNSLVTDSIQSIFTTIFGSYFGDWDVSNNLLRSALARGTSLINAWSGRPVWYFHHMSMGKTVGQVYLNTINNNGNYYSQFGKRLASISLLGDPSLKMYYHKPVMDIQTDGEEVWWNAGDAMDTDGYSVYSKTGDNPWTLFGEGPIMETSINITDLPFEDGLSLMVKPVKFIESRSGSYFNEGLGTVLELITTDVADLTTKPEISIYPNPAGEYVYIKGHAIEDEIQVLDMHGRLLIQTKGVRDINVSRLLPGNYVLVVGVYTQQFVKL